MLMDVPSVHAKLPNCTEKKLYVAFNNSVLNWRTEFGTSNEIKDFHDLIRRENGSVAHSFIIRNLYNGKRSHRGTLIHLSYFNAALQKKLVKTVSSIFFPQLVHNSIVWIFHNNITNFYNYVASFAEAIFGICVMEFWPLWMTKSIPAERMVPTARTARTTRTVRTTGAAAALLRLRRCSSWSL